MATARRGGAWIVRGSPQLVTRVAGEAVVAAVPLPLPHAVARVSTAAATPQQMGMVFMFDDPSTTGKHHLIGAGPISGIICRWQAEPGAAASES
ncbi:hypothetical protein GCM10009734_30960 [Nonomuraea bangladeshensis]